MQVETRHFTRDEYYRMAEAGVIGPDERVELIEGVITPMSPQNPPHARAIMVLTDRLPRHLEAGYLARWQLPLILDEVTEVEPDGMIVRGSYEDFGAEHPHAGDALLVIEVADSSLERDRTVKQALYAKSGLPTYWIVNGQNRTVDVYTMPGDAGYKERRTYAADESVPVPGHPEAALPVGTLFAP